MRSLLLALAALAALLAVGASASLASSELAAGWAEPELVDDLGSHMQAEADLEADHLAAESAVEELELFALEMGSELVERLHAQGALAAPPKDKAQKTKTANAGGKAASDASDNPKPRKRVSAMSKDEFRRQLLNTKPPRRRTGGKGVKPKRRSKKNKNATDADSSAGSAKGKGKAGKSKSKKPRFASLEQDPGWGAGHSAGRSGSVAGASGSSAGRSGSSGGASGTSAGRSGSSGGASGTSAGRSGSSGGASGTSAGRSGSSGGASGTSAGRSGSSGGDSGWSAGRSGSAGGDSGYSASRSGSAGGDSGYSASRSGTSGGNSGSGASRSGTSGGDSGSTAGPIVAPSGPAAGFGAGGQVFDINYVFSRYYPAGKAVPGTAGFTEFQNLMQLIQRRTRITLSFQFKNQGECGSCWAQAAVASMESVLKDQKLFRDPLSVQQVLDCVKSSESSGCEGGTPMDVLDYFKNVPLFTADQYGKFTGKVGECKVPEEIHGKVLTSGGWQMVVAPCSAGACSEQWKLEKNIIFTMSKTPNQPLIAYVDATNWQNYKSGLFPVEQCKSSNEGGNHVVLIVGWGVDRVQSGRDKVDAPYWLVQNSWGTEWGEGGLIKLPWGVNACGISNFVIKAKPLSVANPAQFADLISGFNAKKRDQKAKIDQLMNKETVSAYKKNKRS